MKQPILRTVFICLLAGAALGQSDRNHSELTVLVVDGFGDLESGYLTVRSADAVVLEHRPVDRHPVTLSVAYGKYTVTLEHAILRPQSRELIVDQPEVLLVLATRLSDAVGEFAISEPAGLSIRVKPPAACSQGPIWAKVVGVFPQFSAERAINSYGYALFQPIEPGEYIVLIVDGKQVRANQIARVIGKTATVNIQLEDCAPKDQKSR